MRKRTFAFAFAAALVITASAVLIGQTREQQAAASRYLMPPKEVVAAFDVPPLPTAMLSPAKQVIALIYRKDYPTIAELSEPMLRLAGARVNPKTNGPHRTAGIYAITLKKISDGSEIKVTVPAQANLS